VTARPTAHGFALVGGRFAAVAHQLLTRQLEQGAARDAEPAAEADGGELATGGGLVGRGAAEAQKRGGLVEG
jgi:hypothetical protein